MLDIFAMLYATLPPCDTARSIIFRYLRCLLFSLCPDFFFLIRCLSISFSPPPRCSHNASTHATLLRIFAAARCHAAIMLTDIELMMLIRDMVDTLIRQRHTRCFIYAI